MSLINTNADYLQTMGIAEEDPQVGVIVSVYYLGCAFGAVLFSWLADKYGRKPALFSCLATASLGNLIMFIAGLGFSQGALPVMYLGRVIMGFGVGGVDSVVPVYSSELASDDARGKALAQEFQSNIFGLNMAFAINLAVTVSLGKENEWAWRIPIIVMQVYPVSLLLIFNQLPESPRWFMSHDRKEDAQKSLNRIVGEEEGKKQMEELEESAKQETEKVGYKDMFNYKHSQFHPTMITIMSQVNQALTGYGGKLTSVWPSSIFADMVASRLRLRSSDLRAPQLRYAEIRILDPRQLHLVFRPHDVRLDPHRCSRPTYAHDLGIRNVERLLWLAHRLRWPGDECR